MNADEKEKNSTTYTAVSTEEVFALLKYAANAGISKEKAAALCTEIHKCDNEIDPGHVLKLYTDLVQDTKPVTGRTVVDSTDTAYKRLRIISLITAIFFILAVGNYIADSWLADPVESEEIPLWFLNLKRYVWDYLTPFLWGGLGSCIYLLKTIRDAARAYLYEQHQLKGWGTRILIGSMLAAIVMIIFHPTMFTSEVVPLTPAALAFLIGLGVKVAYGALERLIEIIADKFNFEKISKQPIQTKPKENQ